jgi:hypothetical protein
MQVLKSYNDRSSPAKLAAFIESEMSKIGAALATVRRSAASLESNLQKATDISNKCYQTVRDIGDHRIALVRNKQEYRAQINKTLRDIRAMRAISKIGENAQIDADVVMRMQLISDARRIRVQNEDSHNSAIGALLKVQTANWVEFAELPT